MEGISVGTESFAALGLGAALAFILPVVMVVIWKVKKKEPITSFLIGIVIFIGFALFLEKTCQALLIAVDHPVSRYINAHPWLLAIVTAAFAGIFEETGRLVAFQTILKKREHKETAISYGMGHGGAEVIIIVGITFIEYISFGMMIDQGTFQTLIDQAPGQKEFFEQLAKSIADFRFTNVFASMFERCSGVLFHIGASVMVFFACRKKGKFGLFFLAIFLHALMDLIAVVYSLGIVHISVWVLEIGLFLFGALVFLGAYMLLYKKEEPNSLR